MAKNLKRRTCSDCGASVSKTQHECPECGGLMPARRRRVSLPSVDPECDGVRETRRSLDSRLGEGFGMMIDGFEWIDQVFNEDDRLVSHDSYDEE
ncbi:MAG: hypothetical protein ACKN82_00365 [Pirellula sp.]